MNNPVGQADPAVAHYRHGNELRNAGQLQAALASYDRAIQLKPDYAYALCNRGVVLAALGRLPEALDSYDRALGVDPGDFIVHYNRADALRSAGRLDEAVSSYDRAVELKPDYAQAWCNRGVALASLQRRDAALASYERALALEPGMAEAWSNLGTLRYDQRQWDAALDCFDRALALRGSYAQGHMNRGSALMRKVQVDAALQSYDRAIALSPDLAEAHYNRALCLLLKGELAAGWPEFEWRWNDTNARTFGERPVFAQPRWNGREDIRGRRILIWYEQGLGDTLQFCRYVREVAALGAHVILEVQPPLLGLLAGLEGLAQLHARGAPRPDFDCQCPLLSLPLVFSTTLATVPAPIPYLHCDPARAARWRDRLGERTRPRVGLVWSGSTGHANDADRSIPLAEWIAHLPRDLDYVCVQKELREADRQTLAANPWIAAYTDELVDFRDTAALIAALDLVISVDTSVAHLAGALGKRTWVLLPFAPDWRWLLQREDTPWYPTLRLYRQARAGDWNGVLTRAGADLRALSGAQQPSGPDAAAGAHYRRGNELRDAGRYEAALASYDQVLQLDPGHFHAHFQRGNVLRQLGALPEAIASYGAAIAASPGLAEAHFNRGVLLQATGQAQAALQDYDQAIALNPALHQAHFNRGNALKQLGDPGGAVASYDAAIALREHYPEAWSNRGVALQQLGRRDDALASFERAIALRPGYAEALFNRGMLQKELGRFEAAVASFDQAIAARADYADAHFSRGATLVEMRDVAAALASYDRALALRPDFAEAHYNRALALLLAGDYAAGWPEYEWRWQNAAKLAISDRPPFTQPLWLGREDIRGRRILLWSEQGLGDTLQFCRYAREVAALGAHVILDVQAPLAGLLAHLDGVAELVATGGALPRFDVQCPLMSLPAALRTTLQTIPPPPRHVQADAARLARWQARLGPRTRPRIGLVWSGNALQGNDRNRSVPLAEWIPHLPRQFDYVCLQKEIRPADREILRSHPWIATFDGSLADFSDTAALAQATDLVISVCTSVVHLAGTMGLRTWALLSFNADWRWLEQRRDTPWYPSMTLYRQPRHGDWQDVFARVAADLERDLG